MKNVTSRRTNAGEKRLFTINRTTGFVLAEGQYSRDYLNSTIGGLLSCSPRSSAPVEPLYTGAIIRFFGTGIAGKLFNYRLWFCKPSDTIVRASLFCTGQATLGTKTGASGSPILLTDKVAHGLTCALTSSTTTPRGPGTALYAAYAAGVQLHSPLNNETAELVLPDLCSSTDILIETELVDATDANATVEFLG